jgi:hypothetical protein
MGVSVKKFAAAVALVLTSFMVAPGLAAPANAADDDYTAGTRTSCHLSMPATIDVGVAPRIRVTVSPNGPVPAASTRGAARAARAEQPHGTVTVNITRNGSSIFTRTAAYQGSPITILGPVINQVGRYVVHAKFRAEDGSVFRNCQDTTAFELSKGDGPDDTDGPDGNGGNETPDGLLPDTGGPDLRWLLLGMAMMVAGLGLVVASRERPTPYLV